MFGTNTISSGLTLSKVLSGISKSLAIANQAIPLYQQAKPMIQNARKVLSVLKEYNSNNKNIVPKKTIDVNNAKEKTEKVTNQSNSIPVFFQ